MPLLIPVPLGNLLDPLPLCVASRQTFRMLDSSGDDARSLLRRELPQHVGAATAEDAKRAEAGRVLAVERAGGGERLVQGAVSAVLAGWRRQPVQDVQGATERKRPMATIRANRAHFSC